MAGSGHWGHLASARPRSPPLARRGHLRAWAEPGSLPGPKPRWAGVKAAAAWTGRRPEPSAAGRGPAWRANLRVPSRSYLARRRPRGLRAAGPAGRARPGGSTAAAAARATCGRQATDHRLERRARPLPARATRCPCPPRTSAPCSSGPTVSAADAARSAAVRPRPAALRPRGRTGAGLGGAVGRGLGDWPRRGGARGRGAGPSRDEAGTERGGAKGGRGPRDAQRRSGGPAGRGGGRPGAP